MNGIMLYVNKSLIKYLKIMGKCLVTRLNGVFDDDSMEKFGIIEAGMPLEGEFMKSIAEMLGTWPVINMKCIEGCHVTNNEGTETYTEVHQSLYNPLLVLTEDGVPGKVEWDYYSSEAIHGAFDVSKIYSTTLKGIDATKYTPQGGEGTPGIDTAYGNTDGISERVPNLEAFRCMYMQKVSGKLSDFNGLIKLRMLFLTNSTNFTGDVKDLADAQVAAGRTSGTLRIDANDLITNNGVVIGNGNRVVITFNNGSYVIS